MLLDRLNPKSKMFRRVNLQDINPVLMCVLCHGYLVDATTIIECFHSFCRSCIVTHLQCSKYCPICEVMVHKTKPYTSLRRDKALQDIVYKLVPGLYNQEMQNRRQFYKDRPHYIKPLDIEEADEETLNSYVAEDSIKLSLTDHSANRPIWFLKCPIGVTIKHLKKLILAKYGFKKEKVLVEVMLKSYYLPDDLTLLEISSVRPWRSKPIIEMSYEMLGINEKEPIHEIEDKLLEKNKEVETPEKEIQLQITESGVMCVSEVDTGHGTDSINQIIASSLPANEPMKPEPAKTNSIIEQTREKLKERLKRRSMDADGSQPKKIVKEPELKDEKKILSHSVQNMVASVPKEAKEEPPKAPVVEKKVPELFDMIKKSEKPSGPSVPPNSLEPRIETPKPIKVPTPVFRVIPKEKLRPTLTPNEPRKPAKNSPMRNLRFLGNPVSGVKPLYSNGLSEAPPSSPPKKPEPIMRIDPKTLRPVDKEERKTQNTLLTNPFIPRDKHLQLPDPKTQPYSNVAFPPGFHASLPPTISHLMSHKPYRSVRPKDDPNCDKESRPSASSSKPETSASESFKC